MRRVVLFCLILVAATLSAYDFPAPGGRITSSFGSMSRGNFNTGIDIQAEYAFASEDGEVLFCRDDYIAIAHQDSVLTIYSLLSVPESLSKDIHVKKGQLLGKTKGGILHFAFYDLEMERYINPLLMTEQVKKSELPRVDGLSYDPGQDLLGVQLDTKGLVGLYKVQIVVDGKVASTLGFRTVQYRDGMLLLDAGRFTCGTLYRRQGSFSFPGIHLNQGDNTITVIVTDFYGKKIEFHGRITV